MDDAQLVEDGVQDSLGMDSPTDAEPPIDGPPADFVGRIVLLESQLVSGGNVVAQGLDLDANFITTATAVAPLLKTANCEVTQLSAAQVGATVGQNEGNLAVAVNNGGSPSAPSIPTCFFIGGSGYQCPDQASSQMITAVSSVTIEPLTPQTARLTVNAGIATFNAGDVGRYIVFASTGNAIVNATAAPIISLGATANVVNIGMTLASQVSLTNGMMTTIAAAGPLPGAVDPGQLTDTASATITLAPGGGQHFPATTITYSDAGDDFTMPSADASLLTSIPTNGGAFTLSCSDCGSADATLLEITTTDGSTAGHYPYTMPAPTLSQVRIGCLLVGATSIVVPASVSAYIASSGATRIRTAFARVNLGTLDPASAGLENVYVGHSMLGYTDP